MTTTANGKTVLVTGGSRGIGAAIAKQLAGIGMNVVINYASNEGAANEVVRSITAAGGVAIAVKGDVFREALRVSKQDGVVVFFEPRKEMLERLWVDDPSHPLAANPSNYLPDQNIHEHRIEGSFMDIFIYTKTVATNSGNQ